MNLGMTEVLLLLGIALLLFGPSRLPGLGKSMGEAIRGFKKGLESEEEPTKKHEQLRESESQQVQVETKIKDQQKG